MRSAKILKTPHPNPHLADFFSKELGISLILAQVLINRRINSPKEAQEFLKTDFNRLHDPYLFSDMHKAVELIKKAAGNKERVMIFGDYDCDGITSVALLKNTLSKIGIEPLHYLPHRIKEGYGLSKNILQIAKDSKIDLLITADCGTSSHQQIKELKHAGIKVVITDHHEPSTPDLPEADALINPKTKNSTYKFKELAGVGVAYKLAQALTDSKLTDDLDLVCLGTIADSVPLTDENRIIAKNGLENFPQTKKAGLRALMENAGIENKKFTSTYVSFILGPRINASGRIDSAEVSLELLMSKDKPEAEALAKILEGQNRQRQKIESKILEEAVDLINREVNFKEHKIIVLAKEGWHHGVLGIVASKIADRFYRPSIIISLGENYCKGSGRSVKNFHLFHTLMDCKDFLSNFGGHAHAVGLVIDKANVEAFKQHINAVAKEKMTLEDLLPSIDIDMELSLADLTEAVVRELEILEPFGTGNPEPLFCSRDLKLKGAPQILARETLKFWVTDGVTTHQAIGFRMANFKNSLETAASFDLVYSPRIDSWRDGEEVILEAREIFFK